LSLPLVRRIVDAEEPIIGPAVAQRKGSAIQLPPQSAIVEVIECFPC
jgi:hypothetical protein